MKEVTDDGLRAQASAVCDRLGSLATTLSGDRQIEAAGVCDEARRMITCLWGEFDRVRAKAAALEKAAAGDTAKGAPA